jgi:hypothetical protein
VPSGAGSVTVAELEYGCQADHVLPSVETWNWYTPARLSAKESESESVGFLVSAVFDGAPLTVKLPVGATVSSVSVGVETSTGDALPALLTCVALTAYTPSA